MDKEIDKTEDSSITKEYESEDIIVYWTPSLCSHSANCTHGLPDVFNVNKRPWINMSAASAEDIMKAIDTCPTGALKYKLTENSKEEKSMEEKSAPVHIQVIKKGPFMVKGPVKILDSDGKIIKEDNQMVLCRCNLSKNQPFCDGSHVSMD